MVGEIEDARRGGYYGRRPYYGGYSPAGAFLVGAVVGATIAYASIPKTQTTVVVHEHTYIYSEGVFLTKSGTKYVVVEAPVGGVITELPPGYSIVYVKKSPYYYFNGTYYVVVQKPEKIVYKVVSAPIGAIVEYLPKGVMERKLQGKKYLILHGIWYQPFYSGSDIVYRVVIAPYGVIVTDLPDGAISKTVKGTKYFVHNGVWYKAFYSGNQAIYMITKPLKA